MHPRSPQWCDTNGIGAWDQCRVDQILANLPPGAIDLEHVSYVPTGCNDFVAVILVPVEELQITIAQVTFAAVGNTACLPVYGDAETAWAGDEEFDGKNWATYFWHSCP